MVVWLVGWLVGGGGGGNNSAEQSVTVEGSTLTAYALMDWVQLSYAAGRQLSTTINFCPQWRQREACQGYLSVRDAASEGLG